MVFFHVLHLFTLYEFTEQSFLYDLSQRFERVADCTVSISRFTFHQLQRIPLL